MKTGKELKLNTNENYTVTLGTINKFNPKSVYIKIKAWGDPQINNPDIDYKRVLSKLKREIKQELNQTLQPTTFNNKNFILDFDMRESGVRYNKQSFMSTEINVYQNTNMIDFGSKEMVDQINKIITDVIDKVLNKTKYFKFYKKKLKTTA